jgi:hypothetical protein
MIITKSFGNTFFATTTPPWHPLTTIAASQCYLPRLPPDRNDRMVLVGCCMLGAGWVAPRWPLDDSGRHGREVLLAAHFVSVLCVVLHFRWLSKDMNSYLVSIHMSYEFICRIRTAYIWQITWIVLRDIILASIFLSYDTAWNQNSFFRFRARQMVISTIRILTQFVLQHKIRSFRNCAVHT